MISLTQKYYKIIIFQIFFFFCVFGYANASQISSVTWGAVVQGENSAIIYGTIIPTSGSTGPYNYQVEHGHVINYTGNSPTAVTNISPDFIYTLSYSTNTTTTEPSFNVSFTGLAPAHAYYFRLHEWANGVLEPRGPYRVIITDPPASVVANVNPTSNSLIISGNLGASMNEKQILALLHTSPITGNNAQEAQGSGALPMSHIPSGNGNYSFNFNELPAGGTTPGTTYYFRLFNDTIYSRLPLMNSSSFTIPEPPGGTGGGGGGGNNTTGFDLSSGENFSGGLITCSGVDCGFLHLLTTINRVIRFAIFVIGIPIITLAFVYAGFLLLTSGGNPSKKDEAKSILGKAITGLIFMLAAWLIIRTILVVLGYQGPLITILGITL